MTTRALSESSGPKYVSRGGQKLAHALSHFALDVRGNRCADLGASTGGFTDCLLQNGAAHVTAIDTAYGIFAYKLRIDPRVTLIERTNALHHPPPLDEAKVDLVVIDLGWTPQRLCIPVATRWLKPDGKICTLIKPHYELSKPEQTALLKQGVLDMAEAERVTQRTLDALVSQPPAGCGVRVQGLVQSPILGGATRGKAVGNAEWLALITLA